MLDDSRGSTVALDAPDPTTEVPSGRTDARHHTVKVGWRTVLLTALLTVLLLESGARFVAARSDFADEDLPRLMNENRANVERRDAAGIETDLLFFGSSTTGADLDPNLVPDDRAYALWWAGGGMETIQAFADEVALELFDPETVVIGITSRELNDAGADENAQVLADMERTLAWRRIARPNLATRAEVFASEASALVRSRSHLRHPTEWAYFAQEQIPAGLEIDEAGRLTRFRDRTEPLIGPDDIARETGALADFAVGGRQTAALARLLDTFAGRRVLVVFLPTSHADYTPLHPNGQADVDRARHEAAAAAGAAGVEYLDLYDLGADRALFGDANHLNGEGAELVTRIVLDHLGVDTD